MITMLIGGLWHGAAWNFVIWGGLHGFLLMLHKAMINARKVYHIKYELPRIVNMFIVFNLVTFMWIFFRADTFIIARQIIENLFGFTGHISLELIIIGCYAALLLGLDILLERFTLKKRRFMVAVWSRNWLAETVFFSLIVVFIMFIGGTGAKPFIYFQF